MKDRSVLVIGGVALLTVLAAVSGSMVVAQPDTVGASVDIDATPSDSPPASGESTHTTVFTVTSGSAVAGRALNDIRVDYSIDQPTAQASNAEVLRIGIDRDGDDPGTRIEIGRAHF